MRGAQASGSVSRPSGGISWRMASRPSGGLSWRMASRPSGGISWKMARYMVSLLRSKLVGAYWGLCGLLSIVDPLGRHRSVGAAPNPKCYGCASHPPKMSTIVYALCGSMILPRTIPTSPQLALIAVRRRLWCCNSFVPSYSQLWLFPVAVGRPAIMLWDSRRGSLDLNIQQSKLWGWLGYEVQSGHLFLHGEIVGFPLAA